MPSPINPPSGAGSAPAARRPRTICAEEEPALIDRGQGHPVACHFADEVIAVDSVVGAASAFEPPV